MKKYFDQVENKSTKSFLVWALDNLIQNGKDCFEMQRMCVAWSGATGLPAYDFMEALEKHISLRA